MELRRMFYSGPVLMMLIRDAKTLLTPRRRASNDFTTWLLAHPAPSR